jgi:hypothetical protein
MGKRVSATARGHLEKCRACALAGVEAYNKPGTRFRAAQYVILIVMAWTAFLHALFHHRGTKPWYRTRASGTGTRVRYEKVEGEPKHWDLTECLKQYYGDHNPPERENLRFLIGLRNKIEHRYLPELDSSLFGECQAALLNLEQKLVEEFGQKYAVAEQLAVSLQFSEITPEEKRRATKTLASKQARGVVDYIERFRGGLPPSTLESMRYAYSVFLVPRVEGRESVADAAVQFVKVDEASEDELKRLKKLNVLIREKHVPVANLHLLKPGKVVDRLQESVPFVVNMTVHTRAWRYFKVRPAGRAGRPERTRSEYCVYDKANGDYLYTAAWIEMLTRELSDPRKYRDVTGYDPVPRSTPD